MFVFSLLRCESKLSELTSILFFLSKPTLTTTCSEFQNCKIVFIRTGVAHEKKSS